MKAKRVAIVGSLLTACIVFIFWFYQTLAMPLIFSALLAYLLGPSVDFLDRRVPVQRAFCVLFMIVLVLGAIALAIAGLVPVIEEQVVAIAYMLPKAKDQFFDSWLPWLRDLLILRWRLIDVGNFDDLLDDFTITNQLSEPAAAVQQIMNQTSGVVGSVVNIVLVPVFSFLMLKDMGKIKLVCARLIPTDILPAMLRFRDDVDRTLRNVIKRQLTVALILGVFYIIGFSIVGLKFSVAIGVIAGLCRIVPYLDVIVGALLAAVVVATGMEFSWSVVVGVAIVFLVVQSIDGMFITPRVIGEKVGLHPGIVIASIFAFGDWFGLVGILMAIPVVAVAKIIVVAAIESYRSSYFFTNPS